MLNYYGKESQEKMELKDYIDSTILKPEATKEDIEKLCREAKDYGFKAVCVNPCYASLAKAILKGSKVGVAVVVGFPLGATLPSVKAYEAKASILEGATEIDMVINIGKLKDKQYDYVRDEIKAVKQAIGKNVLKVIIECCLLTDEEKVIASRLTVEGGADFVKTSTGFSKGGATVHDVELLRKTVGPDFGVKAAGGIRTKEEMEAMIKAGADRIGTSRGADLVK